MSGVERSEVNLAAKVFGALLTGGCLLAIGGVLGYLAHGVELQQRAAKMAGGVERPPMVVRAGAVAVQPYNPAERFVGHVEAEQEVEIRARVSGYLAEVSFVEGSLVKAGDLLFRVDDEDYRARVAQRKAEIARAKSLVDRMQKQLKRMEEADPRSISPLDFDNARADDASAKAVLAQAEADLVLSEIELKHTAIYAPFSGRIGRKFVAKGDYIAPSSGRLAKIVQMDPMRVSFPMTDRQYLDFLGQSLLTKGEGTLRQRIVLPDGTEYSEVGQLEFADNELSSATATIQVRLAFPNPKGVLLPNTFVTLLTDAKAPETLPHVPKTAVLTTPDGRIVWKLDAENKAAAVPVEVVGGVGSSYAVKGNLAAGDRIVVDGVHKVQPGQVVVVVQ